MASAASSSSALVRKRTDTELMAPPPLPKKLKRPATVLDEDTYTEALSQIIARDFFPGLQEVEAQREYIAAVESGDKKWISSAGHRLQEAMTPGRRPSATRSSIPNGAATPSNAVPDTPASIAPSEREVGHYVDTNMSLAQFQAKYTSEDNESFYKLMDKQAQKRAEKHAWLWNGNRLPSKQMIKQREVEDRLIASGHSLQDDGYKRDRLAIRDSDNRPAMPDTWDAKPKNSLMFNPESVEDEFGNVAQRAEAASRMEPRAIVYENTKMPVIRAPARPPSPTLSAVRDAVAGHVREVFHDASVVVGGDETPRVNGYAFVDDEDEEPAESAPPLLSLNTGDSTPSPFRLQDRRKREALHHRMVDRITLSKRESARNGLTGKIERTPVPVFPSSPRPRGGLTPAAQRLWSKIGISSSSTPGSSFAGHTPLRARGSHLKKSSKPSEE